MRRIHEAPWLISQVGKISRKYKKVNTKNLISYVISDGRKVNINFFIDENSVRVTEIFEAEKTNSEELQKAGWQAILNNFKKYVESME